jgi:gluconolactonase
MVLRYREFTGGFQGASMTTEAVPGVFSAGTAVERLVSGLGFTEGPVWLPAEGRLLFTDVPGNTIHAWGPDGHSVWRGNSHFAIGLSSTADGAVLACEQATRSLVRYASSARDAERAVLASEFDGRLLSAPNDVVVRSDGAIFFTDPPFGVRLDDGEVVFYSVGMEQTSCNVYKVTDDPRRPALVTTEVYRPNGLAFSPDERLLYVSDTSDRTRHVHVVELGPDDAAVSVRELLELPAGVPDGLRCDVAGNLYCSGPDGVYVYDPAGALLGVLPVPEMVANCTFGGEDGRTLFMTASTSLYSTRVELPGAVLGAPVPS